VSGYLSLVDGYACKHPEWLSAKKRRELARLIIAKSATDGMIHVVVEPDPVQPGFKCNVCGAADGAEHARECRRPRGLVRV
jgi:hypothetical protein